MKTAQKTYPDRTLMDRLTAKGCQVRCLWQMPGPKQTMIAWLEGWLVQVEARSAVVIVQTFTAGGWEAFTANNDSDIDKTVEDVITRVRAE